MNETKEFEESNLCKIRQFSLALLIRDTLSRELSGAYNHHLIYVENEQARQFYND